MRKGYRLWAALLALLLFALPAAASGQELPYDQVLTVHQLMLGCADGYLIQLGEMNIAIDCGKDSGDTAQRALEALRQAGCGPLTAYIATHYHADHAGNMAEILAEFGTVDTLVIGPTAEPPTLYGPLPCGQWMQLTPGDTLAFGNLQALCVGPERVEGKGGINKDSLNIVFTYGQRKMFFTGDYVRSHPVGDEWAEAIGDCDVLKFPHHGLQPFCIDPWVLMIVNPSVILVPGVAIGPVNRLLAQYGMSATVYTVGDGHTVLTTDGLSLDIATHVGEV